MREALTDPVVDAAMWELGPEICTLIVTEVGLAGTARAISLRMDSVGGPDALLAHGRGLAPGPPSGSGAGREPAGLSFKRFGAAVSRSWHPPVMDPDDLETRARLHQAVAQLAAAHSALEALSPGAAERIGLTAADSDRIALLASRALWASTADLHQRGEGELAARVIALASATYPL